MKKNWKRKLPIVILIVAAAFTLFTGLVFLLWNGVLTSALHVGSITFLQAAGILLLARILFGSRGGRKHRGIHTNRCMPGMAKDRNFAV